MKIFVTVGTQLPFARLVQAVDAWAAGAEDAEVFAQIGPKGPENPAPRHVDWTEWIDPAQFAGHVARADLIVSHAGMGSLITALSAGTPILIMPRKAELREHRNDHQRATVSRFEGTPGVFVAVDEGEVAPQIEAARQGLGQGSSTAQLAPFADEALIGAVRDFIKGAV